MAQFDKTTPCPICKKELRMKGGPRGPCGSCWSLKRKKRELNRRGRSAKLINEL